MHIPVRIPAYASSAAIRARSGGFHLEPEKTKVSILVELVCLRDHTLRFMYYPLLVMSSLSQVCLALFFFLIWLTRACGR